jgi:hypothetical protein
MATRFWSIPMPKAARKPPVRIPLPFDKAIEGLLAVDPKKLPARKKARAKKK